MGTVYGWAKVPTVETLNDYQTAARKTAVYPPEAFLVYPALKLAGEAGEVAEKVGKALRGDHGATDLRLLAEIDVEFRTALVKELGDVLWYVANTAADLGVSLSTVAATNIAKLYDRAQRGVLNGSGDNR